MKKVLYKPKVWKDKTVYSKGSIINADSMNNIEKGNVDVSNAVNRLIENPTTGGGQLPEDWLETVKGEKG